MCPFMDGMNHEKHKAQSLCRFTSTFVRFGIFQIEYFIDSFSLRICVYVLLFVFWVLALHSQTTYS